MTEALDLHLSDEQRELYESTRALAAGALKPIADAGRPGQVNRSLIKSLGEHGLLGRLFGGVGNGSPAGTRGVAFAGSGDVSSSAGTRGVAFAGSGDVSAAGTTTAQISAMDLCLIREALARSCTEAETAFGVQGLGAYPILLAGAPTVIEGWIPRVRDGSAVAAFALTEPQAGSDVRALELKAEPARDGDGGGAGYRLTGEKLWISNAPEADIYTVFARAPEGITAFAVPGNCEGLSGEHRRLLAPHAIGSLRFDQVFVPVDHMLGQPGEGFKVAMRTLDLFRPSVGAFAIGMARTALELATARALERSTFGRPLRDNQSISHRIADIAARVEAARLLVHRAAAAHDAGIHDPAVAAMAKLVATETAQEAVDAAVQIHGALGLEQGHPLEHLYREVRAPRIYEGASEIQREIISRRLFRAAGEAR